MTSANFYAAFIPAPRDSYRALMPPYIASAVDSPGPGVKAPMYDILMLALGVVSFALFLGYSVLCLKL